MLCSLMLVPLAVAGVALIAVGMGQNKTLGIRRGNGRSVGSRYNLTLYVII